MSDDKQFTPEELDALDLKAEDEDALFGDTKKEEVIETADDGFIPLAYENAEETLLAMIIQYEDVALYVVQKSGLRDIHFLKRKNRMIFPIIVNVRFSKGACDFGLVADALDREVMPDGQSVLDFVGGAPELSNIVACTPPVVDLKVAQGYVDVIFEQYKLNRMKEVARWITGQKKFDEMKFIDKISNIQQVLADEKLGEYGLISLDVLVADAYDRYKDRRDNPEKYKGVVTGFYWIDKFRVVGKKRVCVVGAKTNVGKSIFASNMITQMILNDTKVLLFTPELNKQEYIDRLICGEARVSIDNWKKGAISDADNAKIGQAQYKLIAKAHNLYIEDKGSQSCGFILNSVRKHMLNHQVDVVVVDYLQKLRYYGDNTKKAITDTMEKFCSFAKDNDIAFVVMSQLRRTDKPEPELSDLKESGDIENFADTVVLLHRNSRTSHTERKKGWYKVEKNRQGENSEIVDLTFNEAYLRFTENDIPQDDVMAQGDSLIAGYDEKSDEELTEQTVVENIIKEQGTL